LELNPTNARTGELDGLPEQAFDLMKNDWKWIPGGLGSRDLRENEEE
jgi:hypothetical protein